MSIENKQRSHSALMHVVKKNTFSFWANSFLKELDEQTRVKVGASSLIIEPPYLETEFLLERYGIY